MELTAQEENKKVCLRTQKCIMCGGEMGDMPGSRDAICTTCGYKDPCCE